LDDLLLTFETVYGAERRLRRVFAVAICVAFAQLVSSLAQ
jgi:hypothetical protein